MRTALLDEPLDQFHESVSRFMVKEVPTRHRVWERHGIVDREI